MNERRDEKESKVTADGLRQASRHDGFRNHIVDAYRPPTTNVGDQFDELLKRLDAAENEQRKPVG
ncbi:hypothetical protein J2X72_004301 [Phyllobacterium sp. 1468]|uniref:hypothetical protein n=1 Tax=Phyllobacterium sp. 1468 TaxID=2817759 RepID=UPI001AE9F876|nr:hypothetical protein [Phyllobacterium sp. 1468]MDR6635487.1 hypothetical protein [Phyllobacterium sp. 1468]